MYFPLLAVIFWGTLNGPRSDLFDEMVTLQQDYVKRVEEKIGSLEVVENGTKVRVLGSDRSRPAIIPTTEELMAYVREPETLRRIEVVQIDALQRAEEKVAIADQTYGLVDNICRRLDADLEEMKVNLQSAGEFQKPGTAKPDDLAAIQVVPGSTDWILAKVISHDTQTGMYQLSDEDIESNKSKWSFRCFTLHVILPPFSSDSLQSNFSIQFAGRPSRRFIKPEESESRRCSVCRLP